MNRRRWLSAVLATVVLSGCATSGIDADPTPLGPALERFAASGRLSLRQGQRHDHVGFDWMHAAERDVFLMLSPLGQGLAEIVRGPSGATLTLPERQPVQASDLSALTRRVLGVSLPLDSLADWVRGARGTAGEIDRWTVTVTATVPYRQRRLPQRVEARRDDVELTILIDEWGEGD